jgi:hypothetical protein
MVVAERRLQLGSDPADRETYAVELVHISRSTATDADGDLAYALGNWTHRR